MATMRNSDRWLTPGVIIAGIIVGGLFLTTVAVGVGWLTSQGLDPAPLITLITAATGAVTGLGGLVLQLAGRATSAKTERNTGVLAGHQAALVETVADLTSSVGVVTTPSTEVSPAVPGSYGLVAGGRR